MDWKKMGLISKIIFRTFLLQFKIKTTISPLQTLNTFCCQGNVSDAMNLFS